MILIVKIRSEFCTIAGSSQKDKLQQAYATLRSTAMPRQIIVTEKDKTNELLKVSEIPKSVQHKHEETEEEEKEEKDDEELMKLNFRKKKNLEEIKYDRDQGNLFEYCLLFVLEDDNSVLSISSTLEEYVDDEEIEYKNIDTKKNTFRIKTKVRERRYSRVNMGKEKSVSRSEGLTLRWGINMD